MAELHGRGPTSSPASPNHAGSVPGGAALDLLIRGGQVVTTQGVWEWDVGIARGTIAGHYAPGTAPPASRVIDATGLLVLAGFIDGHVHCRAPKWPDREDFGSGTRAAAAGGITTICEMPMSSPPTRTAAIVRARRELAAEHAHVDFALWGAGAADPGDVLAMAEEGVCGFKVLLIPPPHNGAGDFDGICVADTSALYGVLEATRQTGLYCAVHAEDNRLVALLTDRLRTAGQSDPLAYGRSRPPFVEDVAVATVLIVAEELQARVYLPHTSSAGAVDLARAAKARGADVVVETCPHYLFFDESVMQRVGPYGRISPPIRARTEVEGLWRGLADRTVDVVSSDHVPYIEQDKEPFWSNIWGAALGHPGLETLGPSMLDAALSGRLRLERLTQLLSEQPARVFGFYPKKGVIVPGSDADLVLVDPQAEWVVRKEELLTGGRQTARLFDGARLRGRIVKTLVRGNVVYDHGEVVGAPGHGEYVRPMGPGQSGQVPALTVTSSTKA